MDSYVDNLYFSNMKHIENYNLFGERTDLPDVVHCETIETRSRIHNWEFKPHRHAQLHQFVVIESGSGWARIEGNSYDLQQGTLLNIPTGTVHGFRFEVGTHGWVVTLASELLDESLHDSEGLRPLLAKAKVTQSTPEIWETVQKIFAEHASREFARAHTLRALSGLLAGLVARSLSALDQSETRPSHNLQLRFEALLDQHFHEHLKVSDYADRLAVTPTHLTRVMRQVTGQPASAAIEDRLIREARRNLAYSNLSISEIAYELGFDDPAYFSRVFSRATGMAPRAFRAHIEKSDVRPKVV